MPPADRDSAPSEPGRHQAHAHSRDPLGRADDSELEKARLARLTLRVNCILCCISAGNEPAEVLFRDETIMAILPLKAMSRVHLLLFPQAHIEDLPSMLRKNPEVAARLMQRADAIASDAGLGSSGYRLAWNYGPDTNQRIPHPHLHLLGGQRLANALA